VDWPDFKGKTLLITGGTGSFGHAVLNRFLSAEAGEIRVFSRDEKKQDDMRRRYKSDRLRFYIGDVRNIDSVYGAIHGVDFIFHAAALKQVPSCEFFPLEAVKTNVLGTDNVLNAAIDAGVEKIVCLSTDKAAYPINAMGISKAMMEKVIMARARAARGTVVACTRHGNVMCSRGSVIPLFIEQIRQGGPLTVTNPEMTRFLMSLDEAVELVLYAFLNARPGDLFIQQAQACTIGVLAQAVKDLFGSGVPVKQIGTRHGEKLYETLATSEELAKAVPEGGYYRVPADLRGLNYEKYFVDGVPLFDNAEPYTSHNTRRLDLGEVKARLLDLAYIQDELRGRA